MKKKTFKKTLTIYTIILILLSLVFLFNIYSILVNYENNQTGNFLRDSIANIDDETLKKYLADNNQDVKILDSYKKMIKSKDIEFKRGKDDNTFEAILNNRLLFTIETKVLKEVTKLGIFSYQEREIESIKPSLERGLVYYDIIVPSNFKVLVDGNEITNINSKEKYKDLDFMYYNNSMPELATYNINNLDSEKSVKVEDPFGKEIELNKEKYTYTTDIRSINVESIDDANSYINDIPDISTIAHNWSLYLSRDLTGGYYGFNNIISNYLINGTDLYRMAYNWSHNVDILFTSKHTLGNPPFENEKINNFKIYGKDAFSCEIYVEKVMFVAKKEQRDIMHDYLYFIKNNNEWKLINIKAVGD